MENNQIMLMEKLGVFGILKESLKIPYRCPKFIIFTILTSLPLYFTMLLFELILLQTFIATVKFLEDPYPVRTLVLQRYNQGERSWTANLEEESTNPLLEFIQNISHRLPQLALLYVILHLLDLLSTISTVHLASVIYAEEKPMGLKEMFNGLINKARFTGPLITSMYVFPLNLLNSIGLIWTATTSLFLSLDTFYRVSNGVCSVVLLLKWSDWSAIWNMGVVLSILEERHGIEALGGSAYFSRNSRQRGLLLMLIFFIWRFGLRVLCHLCLQGNGSWSGNGIVVIWVLVSLVCFGNVMKWLACLVYFYDCKKRTLEKKVDVEEGKEVKLIQTDLH